MIFLGVDLAWRENAEDKLANLSGVVAIDGSGTVLDAAWRTGIDDVAAWLAGFEAPDAILFVDAPLVVANETGQRRCEREVGQRYGRWKVSAHSTNLQSKNLGGIRLLQTLENAPTTWLYHDGATGPQLQGRVVYECYPYTTIVGTEELGYGSERPAYKKLKKGLPTADARRLRAEICDELISRVNGLMNADPPLDLGSHEVARELIESPSPLDDVSYKKREDLLDAAVCAWTASLWASHGTSRCQVLGLDPNVGDRQATIVAPARPEQR